MRSPFILLKYLAKALGNAFGGGVAGDLVVEVLPEAARDAWDWWSKERNSDERNGDLEAVAQAEGEPVTRGVSELVLEVAGDKNSEVQEAISLILTQVPSMVRKALRRPSDPTGRTVSSDRAPKGADDLLTFMPAKPSRFKPGDHPLPSVDLELVELIGIGGFGEVWKARNPNLLNRPPVALKFCLDSTAAKVLRNEAAILDRVMREGKQHPGIVELLHTYLNAATPCLEYEFIEGGDLAGVISERRRSGRSADPAQVVKEVLQIAEIVGFAHRLKPPIVHRDLKPANILVSRGDGATTFKVADFGIGSVAATQMLRETGRRTHGILQTSVIRGAYTPHYASPQQTSFQPPDPRDDVYAIGVIWYQMLLNDLGKGRPGGDKYKSKLTELGMNADLIALLGRCFEEEAEDRPSDAVALAEEIRRLSVNRSATPRAPAVPPTTTSARVPEETQSPPRQSSGLGWSDVVTLNVNDHFNIWRTRSGREYNGWLTQEMCRLYTVIVRCEEREGQPVFRFVPFSDRNGNGMVVYNDSHERSRWFQITAAASNKSEVQLRVRYRVEAQLVRGWEYYYEGNDGELRVRLTNQGPNNSRVIRADGTGESFIVPNTRLRPAPENPPTNAPQPTAGTVPKLVAGREYITTSNGEECRVRLLRQGPKNSRVQRLDGGESFLVGTNTLRAVDEVDELLSLDIPQPPTEERRVPQLIRGRNYIYDDPATGDVLVRLLNQGPKNSRVQRLDGGDSFVVENIRLTLVEE